MNKSIEVYVSGIVRCPESGFDQSSDECLSCKNFSEIKARDNSRLYIECGYTGHAALFRSRSGRQCTNVQGEPKPSISKDDAWKRVTVR